MHEFKPEVRGPAFTKKFMQEHPDSIKKSMHHLIKRIDNELLL